MKANPTSKLLLTCILSSLVTLSAQAQLSTVDGLCQFYIESPQRQSPGFDFTKLFRRKGLDLEKLKFQTSQFGTGSIHINLSYENRLVGTLLMVPAIHADSPQRSFETHINFTSEFRDMGLGTTMYIAGALTLYRRYLLTLQSSDEPSGEAVAMWQRFVANGWAEQIYSSFGMRFQFLAAVLDRNFADFEIFLNGHNANLWIL